MRGGKNHPKGKKNAEMEKGLRWDQLCLLVTKGKQAHADKQQADMKGFHSMRRQADFYSAWPTLSLQHSGEATQILHEDLTLIVADSNILG